MLKLLNDFHRKLIYLCKIYDSPPGIVTNPLHILGPLMTTRCGGVTPRQNTIIVPLHFAMNYDLFYLFTTELPRWNYWMTSTGSWFICAIYIYDSPPGIVGMIISMKIWDHLLKQIHISNAISLNSDEHQSHTHHLHVMPPKVKVWISDFVLFQKVDICSRTISIVKSVTSSSFSVVV